MQKTIQTPKDTSWWAFHGDPEVKPEDVATRLERLLKESPPWRVFGEPDQKLYTPLPEEKGDTYRCDDNLKDMVNAALVLRRPLLLTGEPGSGKSSLAYAVARELDLGRVLRWNITSRATLKDGLYNYDALGRLQESDLQKGDVADIGRFITLGPLGTALLPWKAPRVLLIDEIDKSDIDLPNDLLHVFEEGEYEIPELVRHQDLDDNGIQVWPDKVDRPWEKREQARENAYKVTIMQGRVRCSAFPFVILTSNAEREFPPAFLRRCLRMRLSRPEDWELMEIVNAHFALSRAEGKSYPSVEMTEAMIKRFLAHREKGTMANDQLLQALYLRLRGGSDIDVNPEDEINNLITRLLNPLNLPERSPEKQGR
jgi:MoxR-like ATPase